MSERVLLAMSGGVDSSVAACLLREQGYEVIGLFMRTGVHDEAAAGRCALPLLDAAAPARSHKHGCCSAADADDARRVADRLDIPFYAIDFEDEFARITKYFVDEYVRGRTPNPCVMCNNWLKFGRLWQYAQQIGADRIATGHYARVRSEPGPAPPGTVTAAELPAAGREPRCSLLRAFDPTKDQSYVLYGLRREILPHLLLPIGEYPKPRIRAIARELGLRVADKPDSQEICFVPTHDYQGFIRDRRPDFDGSGDIVDTAGNVLGRHDGFEAYTIGQRKGLGIALGERRYVVAIDPERRRVTIGSREDLLERSLDACQLNWLCDPPAQPLRCAAKIRYLHQAAAATVIELERDRARVTFDAPQSAITPGQAVVFYDGDRVLGGGIIDAVERGST